MAIKPLKPRQFRVLAAAVHRHTGVTMEDEKITLLSNRIRRRVRALGMSSVDEYIDLIESAKASSEELLEFIDVVTTHKTSFFRTPEVWKHLVSALPELDARRAGLAVWSAASSSGQEAYSIAMMLDHLAEKKLVGATWRVAASDVSARIAARAEKGLYDAADVEAAEAAFGSDIPVRRHFAKAAAGQLQVRPALKQRMRFRQHNLLDPIDQRFDVVFLRNVIIYFSEPDLARVLSNVRRALNPGGYLVIGESESLLSRTDELEWVAPCIYRHSN